MNKLEGEKIPHMFVKYNYFIEWIRNGYSRPWDRAEKILIVLTTLSLLSDALLTLKIYNTPILSYPFHLTYIERNYLTFPLLFKKPLLIFPYFLSWLGVIVLFRIIRSAEFTLAIIHITSSSTASINNLGLLLFKEPIIASLLEPYSLRVEPIILIILLIYMFAQLFHILKVQKQQYMFKEAFLYIIGLFSALLTEIGITVVWEMFINVFLY